jgi:hypothetical protein
MRASDFEIRNYDKLDRILSKLCDMVDKGQASEKDYGMVAAAVLDPNNQIVARLNRPASNGQRIHAERAAMEALVAKTIGVDTAVIKTRLAAGESLGAIAGAKKDALIAVLVAEKTKHIDAAVTAGKLNAAQATTMKAGLVAHVTTEVNSVGGPKGGPGMGGKGGPEMGKDKGHKGHKGGKGGHGPKGGMKPPAAGVTPL